MHSETEDNNEERGTNEKQGIVELTQESMQRAP